MRLIKSAPGEYYHICNRGMHKQKIFADANDYLRFLFQILHFQSPKNFTNITEDARAFGDGFRQNNRHPVSIINMVKDELVKEICDARTVELMVFSLMPNHFHLIVKELSEGGIATYLQRTQGGFTKYTNIKHRTSGHLLQGPYRIVHIENNEQLLYTTAYVHRNCCELSDWKNTPQKYPWSSYQDYLGRNRWSQLLNPKDILEQFDSLQEYENWTQSSGAKDFDEEIRKIEN